MEGTVVAFPGVMQLKKLRYTWRFRLGRPSFVLISRSKVQPTSGSDICMLITSTLTWNLSYRCGKSGLSLHSVDFHLGKHSANLVHRRAGPRNIRKARWNCEYSSLGKLYGKILVCTNNPMLCCNPLLQSVLSVRVTCACTDESWNCTHLHLPIPTTWEILPPCLSSDYSGRQFVLQIRHNFFECLEKGTAEEKKIHCLS
jgi:hypothetical protein